MKKTVFVIKLLFLFMIGFSQSSEDILLTIGDEKVTSDEFLRIYNKNNNIENQIDPKTIDEYLDLFINFKLKVIEAESLGMDTMSSFINELAGYREQLTKPYLRDDSYDDMLVEEAYERTKSEVHASHIMVLLDEFASPKDTLYAYEKIMSIRKRVLDGEPFDVVAKATSDDPSAQNNGGDLGYFSAFRMVYPFETAAYTTPVGDISMPVRTRFGYHIVKVHDKRPSPGSVGVAHVMVATPEAMPPVEKENAQKKIIAIYDSIMAGKEFAYMAIEHSDDKRSGRRGGELQMFSTGQMVPEFERAAFELKEIGDISKPVKTAYGWHIIKLLRKKPVPGFEEIKKDLENKVKRDLRNKVGENIFVEKLKAEYNYTENYSALEEFYTVIDSAIFMNNWNKEKASNLNKTIFTLTGKEFSQAEFLGFLLSKKASKPMPVENYINSTFKEFVHASMIDFEKSRLEEKYPEFRYLMEEYHDGILLFDLTDKMVWSKAVEDSVGLEKFYNENKNNYMWGERLGAAIFTFTDESLIKPLTKATTKGIKKNYSAERIKKMICDTADCLTIEEGKYEKGQNELIDKVAWGNDKGIYWPEKENDEIKLIMVREEISPEPKKLDEAKGIITADYQNFLEQEWIKELRVKYEISVDEDALTKVKKEQANL